MMSNLLSSLQNSVISDELIDRIHYWCPPVQGLRPQDRIRTSLRIAVIVDEQLFDGLRYEGHLLLLTPDNYSDIIQNDPPDLILIESCRKSVTGHWQHAQIEENQQMDCLQRLIALAKKNDIPCCYWFTADHLYHENFKKILPCFDTIFCADPLETELLQSQGFPALTLLPAIQPRVHHPFRLYQKDKSFEIEVVFDGWADLLHYKKQLPFEKIDVFDVKIIDSRNLIFKEKLDDLPENREQILGCVGRRDRLTTLLYSTAAISFEKTLATPTTQSWMALETLGCRVPMLYHGELSADDIRKDLVIEVKDVTALRVALSQLIEEPAYREQLAQQVWRDTHEKHTFSHRLKNICETIGMNYPKADCLPVTVITPTRRPENIGQVLETFKRQVYPDKELVIVYNGPTDKFNQVEKAVKKTSDLNVKLLTQPTELYAGACLNSGAHAASGQFCFRMDDDDHYADRYLPDMMLHLDSVDADLFGKPPVPLYFENTREVCFRKSLTPQLTKLPNDALRKGLIWLGGNTIAGKTEVFLRNGYQDTVFGSADSAFQIEASQHQLNFYSFDQTNVIASRREDDSHTWKSDNTKLKKKSILVAGATAADVTDNGFLSVLSRGKTVIKHHGKKQVILYIGPGLFREGVWQNRVKYIFPDLFTPLLAQFSIHMLTVPVPEFAKAGIGILQKEYNVTFHELSLRETHVDPYSYWIQGGKVCAEKIGADIVTNVFGGVLFGYTLTYIAKLLNIHSVVRVAGDEIASRVAIGTYQRKEYYENCAQFRIDKRKEMLGFSRADRIIVMSPWERERVVEQCAGKNNVRIAIRGIDLQIFKPSSIGFTKPVKRFLFVGRNSLEKGYDLIEEAAKRVEKNHPELEFVFAGNFEVAKAGNREYVGFVQTEKLPELYESVDAVILSSRTEGMPQVVLEAMAMGKPCILSKHLFETQFSDGIEALLVKLEPEHLVQQILRLHNDISLANLLAENSRAYAEKYFSKSDLRDMYKDVFLELFEEQV